MEYCCSKFKEDVDRCVFEKRKSLWYFINDEFGEPASATESPMVYCCYCGKKL